MDLNPTLRNITTLYIKSKTEPSLNTQKEIEKQLEILQTILSSRPGQITSNAKSTIMENIDSINCLITILGDKTSELHFTHKVLIVLNYFILDSDVLEFILTDTEIINGLTAFFQHSRKNQTPNITITLLCLRILQRLTYRLHITCPNGFIEELVSNCVDCVISHDDDSQLHIPCLEIISNLSYFNISVQAYIKGLSNISDFNRILILNVKATPLLLIILSLAILSNIYMHEELGGKIFTDKNLEQTFQLVFSLISHNSFITITASNNTIDDDPELIVRYAVDLLCNIVKDERIENQLIEYDQLSRYLYKIVQLLITADGCRTAKILDLLMCLAKIDKINPIIVNAFFHNTSEMTSHSRNDSSSPFISLLNWVGQPLDPNSYTTTFLALDFLQELFGVETCSQASLNLLLPVISKQLNVSASRVRKDLKNNSQNRVAFVKLVKILHLFLTLFKHKTLTHPLSEALNDNCLIQFYNSLLTLSPSLFALQNDSKCIPNIDEIINLLLYTLKLFSLLSVMNSEFKTVYNSSLEDGRLLPFLSYSLSNGDHTQISIVLDLLKEALSMGNFQLASFADFIRAVMSNSKDSQSPNFSQPSQKTIASSQNSSFSMNISNLGGMRGSNYNIQDVNLVIEKMRKGISLGEMRNKDIVDIYEYKLATLNTKEAQLQAQLEAKNMSLQQAERVAAQVRCRRAESETICQNLNLAIKELSDKLTCETSKFASLEAKQKELMHENTNYETELENLRNLPEKCLKLSSEIERKNVTCNELQIKLDNYSSQLETLRKSNEVYEVNNETLKNQQERHFEQIKELEAEKQKLKHKLHDKDKINKELEMNCAHFKAINQQIERNHLEVIAERDTLTNQLSIAHKQNEDMNSQVNFIKSENMQLMSDLKTANEDNRQLKSQLERMQQLTSMIHNLSGNSNPTSKMNF